MNEYGRIGLEAMEHKGVKFLARLNWYTIEFGLIRKPEGIRIYGAGIVSSFGEAKYVVGDPSANQLTFNLERVLRTGYYIDDFQAAYFVIDRFEDLFDLLKTTNFNELYDKYRNEPALHHSKSSPRTWSSAGAQANSGRISRRSRPSSNRLWGTSRDAGSCSRGASGHRRSPVWYAAHRALFWVDIPARKVHSYDPASRGTRGWSVPEEVGCVAPMSDGALLIALKSSFQRLDPGDGSLGLPWSTDEEPQGNRFNDGKTDRQGRFWCGSMDAAERSPTGASTASTAISNANALSAASSAPTPCAGAPMAGSCITATRTTTSSGPGISM